MRACARLWLFSTRPQCLHTSHKNFDWTIFFYLWLEVKTKVCVWYIAQRMRRQIRKSLLAQRSLKQIFGGFHCTIFGYFFSYFDLDLGFQFVERVCMCANNESCLPTNDKNHRRNIYFTLRRKLNRCWRNRYIPAMVYVMQKTNKSSLK